MDQNYIAQFHLGLIMAILGQLLGMQFLLEYQVIKIIDLEIVLIIELVLIKAILI